jgi:hypothetical protein
MWIARLSRAARRCLVLGPNRIGNRARTCCTQAQRAWMKEYFQPLRMIVAFGQSLLLPRFKPNGMMNFREHWLFLDDEMAHFLNFENFSLHPSVFELQTITILRALNVDSTTIINFASHFEGNKRRSYDDEDLPGNTAIRGFGKCVRT